MSATPRLPHPAETPPAGRSPFVEAPGEVRDAIYEQLLQDSEIDLYCTCSQRYIRARLSGALQLASTCSQIRDETLCAICSETVLTVRPCCNGGRRCRTDPYKVSSLRLLYSDERFGSFSTILSRVEHINITLFGFDYYDLRDVQKWFPSVKNVTAVVEVGQFWCALEGDDKTASGFLAEIEAFKIPSLWESCTSEKHLENSGLIELINSRKTTTVTLNYIIYVELDFAGLECWANLSIVSPPSHICCHSDIFQVRSITRSARSTEETNTFQMFFEAFNDEKECPQRQRLHDIKDDIAWALAEYRKIRRDEEVESFD
jgi:hypothetical protein